MVLRLPRNESILESDGQLSLGARALFLVERDSVALRVGTNNSDGACQQVGEWPTGGQGSSVFAGVQKEPLAIPPSLTGNTMPLGAVTNSAVWHLMILVHR